MVRSPRLVPVGNLGLTSAVQSTSPRPMLTRACLLWQVLDPLLGRCICAEGRYDNDTAGGHSGLSCVPLGHGCWAADAAGACLSCLVFDRRRDLNRSTGRRRVGNTSGHWEATAAGALTTSSAVVATARAAARRARVNGSVCECTEDYYDVEAPGRGAADAYNGPGCLRRLPMRSQCASNAFRASQPLSAPCRLRGAEDPSDHNGRTTPWLPSPAGKHSSPV